MTLTPWQKLVKPRGSLFLVAGATALLTWLIMTAWYTHRTSTALDAYGRALAQNLATLSAEPFMAQNRILLGLLANRVTALPEVQGVAIYGLDKQNLALTQPETPATGGRHRYFTASVTVNDSLVGYVRITLADPGWLAGSAVTVLTGILLALAMALLLTGAAVLRARPFAPWSLARIPERLGRRQRDGRPDAGTLVPAPPAPVPEPNFLMAASFYSPLQLGAQERSEALELAGAQLDRVAALYGAQWFPVSNRGLILQFASDDDPDRPFQVLCAGFLLSGCLDRLAVPGEFRLGCHTLDWRPDKPLPMNSPVLEDTLLVATCARPAQLAVTDAFFQRLRRRERLTAQPLAHPLGDDLATTGADCQLITALGQSYHNLIERQVAFLTRQPASTASASTF